MGTRMRRKKERRSTYNSFVNVYNFVSKLELRLIALFLGYVKFHVFRPKLLFFLFRITISRYRVDSIKHIKKEISICHIHLKCQRIQTQQSNWGSKRIRVYEKPLRITAGRKMLRDSTLDRFTNKISFAFMSCAVGYNSWVCGAGSINTMIHQPVGMCIIFIHQKLNLHSLFL